DEVPPPCLLLGWPFCAKSGWEDNQGACRDVPRCRPRLRARRGRSQPGLGPPGGVVREGGGDPVQGYPGRMRSMHSLYLMAATALLVSCSGTPVSQVHDGRLAQRPVDDSRCADEGESYWTSAGESPGQKGAAVALYEQCMRAKGWEPEPAKFAD